jgi:hypothetical protein
MKSGKHSLAIQLVSYSTESSLEQNWAGKIEPSLAIHLLSYLPESGLQYEIGEAQPCNPTPLSLNWIWAQTKYGRQHLATVLQSSSSLNHSPEFGQQPNREGRSATLGHSLAIHTSLNVRNNKIGNRGAQHLATALQSNSSLTELNLCDNQIQEAEAQHLVTALQSNSTLTSLDFHSNALGDVAVRNLATALQSNSSLSRLNIFDNEIEDTGAQHLSQAFLSRNPTPLSLNCIWTTGGHSYRHLIVPKRTQVFALAQLLLHLV